MIVKPTRLPITVKGKKGFLSAPVSVRFWMKVNKTEGCWEWIAGKDRAGYGVIGVKNGKMKSHRWSYTDAYGTIPKGLYVCHHCDNPKCVRPDHLFLGTAKDNTQDALRKGRLKYKIPMVKTHCKRGHEFTPEGTIKKANGRRQCKICVKARKTEYDRQAWKNLKEARAKIKKLTEGG